VLNWKEITFIQDGTMKTITGRFLSLTLPLLLAGCAHDSKQGERAVSSSGGTYFNGISCTGVKPAKPITPMLLIKDISRTQATLSLSLDDGIPDTRNSHITKTVQKGRTVAGYVSDKSSIDSSLSNFAFYTNGSTRQDTTKGTLSFEDGSLDLEMECKDGMGD
jgi:hypothetical protein